MSAEPSAFVFGEAMVELSGIEGDQALVGVAGDTFNTSVYLARAGVDVAYVSALGACAFSDRIRAACRREGVDDRHILTIPDGTPGLYAVSVDDAGERSFTYWRSNSAVRRFFQADTWRTAFRAAAGADLFYLSGITLSVFSAEDRGQIFTAMQDLRDGGTKVAFDPNFRPAGWPDRATARAVMERAVSLSSIVLPTFDDERALFDDADPQACAARNQRLGADEVVVKHGPEGAYVADLGWVAPPRTIKPVDTTGAGDSFNGAYLAARLRGDPPKTAAMDGHRLAAEVLMTPGAITPQPVSTTAVF